MTTVNDTKVDLDDHPTVDAAVDAPVDAPVDAVDVADRVDVAVDADAAGATVAVGATGADDAEPEPEPAVASEALETLDPASASPRHPRRLVALLIVAAVAVGGLGAWFLTEASAARSSAASRNTALVDTGTTAEVSAAITNSLNKVFSYSYDKPEITERAAAEALRGPALDTYDRLFAQVRELAPQQKIVLTTRVVHIAVQSITGPRAQLLVFLDQSATRADNNTTSTGAAQLSVTAERDGDTWAIIDLTPR